jgi:hypothetical protein
MQGTQVETEIRTTLAEATQLGHKVRLQYARNIGCDKNKKHPRRSHTARAQISISVCKEHRLRQKKEAP